MKAALRQLLVSLRAERKRAEGSPRHPLASRASLDRVLAHPASPEVDLGAIKSALAQLVRTDEDDAARTDLARHAADLLWRAVPRVLAADERVRVSVENRPAGLTPAVARAMLGSEDGWLSARAAAAAVHRLSGRMVGGARLEVRVELPVGTALPAVPREARGDRSRWGRDAPWLNHLDELGRRSLTPRPMARRLARVVAERVERVVDACCGCGGNAIAFAAAGLSVVGLEIDPGRAQMARLNAREHGLSSRLKVRTASVEQALDGVLREGDLLFVDPPWEHGPALIGERADDFGALFHKLPRLASAVRSWPAVVLKLPRAFDVKSLPGGPETWTIRYERGAPSSGDAHIVRMITATRGLSSRGSSPTR